MSSRKQIIVGLFNPEESLINNKYMTKERAKKAIKMIAAHELKLRNEGRDFFKKELLLDIERQEKRGWEFREIYDNIKNLLRN